MTGYTYLPPWTHDLQLLQDDDGLLLSRLVDGAVRHELFYFYNRVGLQEPLRRHAVDGRGQHVVGANRLTIRQIQFVSPIATNLFDVENLLESTMDDGVFKTRIQNSPTGLT